MLSGIKLQASTPPKPSSPSLFRYNNNHNRVSLWKKASTLEPSASRTLSAVPFPTAATTITNDASPSSLTYSVGSPPSVPITQWNLNHRHIHLLNAIACAAFKKAAESLEKLLDVTREELPDTMAAVRLSGMEISDLTMELSDLGQEITQGVRNSTRAVRMAEDRLRRLTNMAPAALVQEKATLKTEMVEPVMARTVRTLKEGIVNGRAILQAFFSLTQFSRWAMKYVSARGKQ
ncbi:uncharacterized protein LOC131242176 isoform X2 [Magnolia sinica]|uniref:uncharacterized protein LOC131242176 isoform X2 n=1 Tax=Magnolia sinica TaxID=86752 RepID=UPI002657D349|nr:uncharacterized protein LOC131242176 isoform X2 [Magnolia sinica]